MSLPSRIHEEAERVDVAVYAAIAGTSTPTLDRAMARLSRAADYSRLSLAAAAVLATAGGASGRRAAKAGLASVGVTATIINLVVQAARAAAGVPTASLRRFRSTATCACRSRARSRRATRRLPSPSPPASDTCPSQPRPLHGLAALVAYSRVHTGVHYPGDVIVGSLLGVVLAQLRSTYPTG